jgi:magnesium transporter
MEKFELTRKYIKSIQKAIDRKDEKAILEKIDGLHPADVAEILDELDIDHGLVILQNMDGKRASDVIIELEDDIRALFLDRLSSQEIAEQLVENLDSDDAADVISELPEDKREEVISNIDDVEQASDIVSLLNYEEGTAGALMGKEMIWVSDDWTVKTAVKEMRRQAEQIDQVYTVYVVDANQKLLGRLPVKKLLTTPVKTRIGDVYREDIRVVKTWTAQEEVAQIMEKYDLVVLPVIDELGRLVGRITIDDVVDVIKEEAEKDYQLASGISSDVDQTDTVWQLTRARLPWLLIGMMGGMLSALVIGQYEHSIKLIPAMAFFIPLITAMAGNIGVQSSAIIVQGLANNSLELGGILPKLSKEFSVALLNGVVLSLIALMGSYFVFRDFQLGLTVSLALLTVIIVAALLGTFVPLMLDKYKIDPALATGPFITTLNDIIGLFIYFMIGQLIFTTL